MYQKFLCINSPVFLGERWNKVYFLKLKEKNQIDSNWKFEESKEYRNSYLVKEEIINLIPRHNLKGTLEIQYQKVKMTPVSLVLCFRSSSSEELVWLGAAGEGLS